MVTVFYILIAFIFGGVSGGILVPVIKAKFFKPDKFLRRGLSTETLTATTKVMGKDHVDTIQAQFEFGEIERTEKKSKIKIISVVLDDSSFCTPDWNAKIKSLKDNKWVDSSTIEWIEDDLSQKRADKINEILKK